MTRYAYEQHTKVVFAPTVSDISGPTTTEIAAGTDLTPFTKKDGVKVGASQNMVDNATIETAFDAQVVGSWGVTPELTMFRDSVDGDDDAWNLTVYGTTGFLIIRRGEENATGFVDGQKVEVYPAQMHEPINNDSGANENTSFVVKFAVTSQPDQKATVGGY